MNTNFKPLGLVAAVATATAGYAGVTNAQELAGNTQLGDLGIVPYYTVVEGFATGVNIINTSDRTQVVKFRFRRAPDSMDALDFNVVLSPEDMYTGYVSMDAEGDIGFTSNDNSCTAPAYYLKGTQTRGGNTHWMPSIYAVGADTGYIEIISMGSPDSESAAVAVNALHDSNGMPANCDYVRDNFRVDGVSGTSTGVVDSTLTVQRAIVDAQGTVGIVDNNWEVSPDTLKVSYFIKSDDSGVEFGNNAVHIAGHMDGPAMTNQQRGVFDGDLLGFDHPNLNGGSPIGNGASIALYEPLRTVLGADALVNDWSANEAGPFTVDTDWVVTIPGQYLMLDLPFYQASLDTAGAFPCPAVPTQIPNPTLPGETITVPACDFRDIPMTAVVTVYDREEKGIVLEDDDLVVSPQPPNPIERKALPYEVNVIEWGNASVLKAPLAITDLDKPAGASFGWASLVATPAASKTQSICSYIPGTTNPVAAAFGYSIPAMTCAPTTTPAPMVGFVAWQRNFEALAAANYGRIVEHSRVQSSN